MIPPDELFGPETKPLTIRQAVACVCVEGQRCDLPCLGSITERPATMPIKSVRWLSVWRHKLFKVLKWEASSSDPFPSPVEDVESNEDEADIIASQIEGSDRHTLMLDLDVPAILIPSGTPGNSHLYIDVQMRWKHVVAILEALVDAGVLQDGYAKASIARGYTALRLPWKPKRT